MPVLFYKLLHLLGVMALFLSLGGVIAYAKAAGTGTDAASPIRKLAAATHGIALLLLLVSGFGMVAKYKLGLPPWVIAKVVVWLALGAWLSIARRKPAGALGWWCGALVFGGVAAALALYRVGA